VKKSSILDNIFRAAYKNTPDITGLYCGMEDGMFRVYPQDRLDIDFLIPYENDPINCTTAQYIQSFNSSRYDHRCFLWYNKAQQYRNSVTITLATVATRVNNSIYTNTTTDIVTYSKAITDSDGQFIGVFSMDVKVRKIMHALMQLSYNHIY
jgi:hypothetical protein